MGLFLEFAVDAGEQVGTQFERTRHIFSCSTFVADGKAKLPTQDVGFGVFGFFADGSVHLHGGGDEVFLF